MQFPNMTRIKQKFLAPIVADIPLQVHTEVQRAAVETGIKRGDRVCVAVGSRGIANMALIAKQTVATLQTLGAKPFIVPAMGSHGGATSAGQVRVLSHYGITEQTMGVSIRSEIIPTQVAVTEEGIPVYVDQHALAADQVVVINRVKPHTDFRGAIESGLMKILAIGLGKQKGANTYHGAAFTYGFERVIVTVARTVMQHTPVAFGLALLENAYEQTALIEAIPTSRIESRERQLLKQAKQLQPKLPFDPLDLLIVDWMGKNISGTGMDANIIGRRMQTHEPELTTPHIVRIFVRDLTADSEGNAVGVGLADFTTRRLVDKIDRKVTYINSITGMGPQKSRIPVYFDNDRETLEAALSTIGPVAPEQSRVVRIKSTLHLGQVDISDALLEQLNDRQDLERIGKPSPFAFDTSDNMIPMD